MSTIYRVLVRQGLVDAIPRRRRRQDYKRWQRDRPMELWQLDIVDGVRLADGSETKIVTGVDDHSRFCVIATVVRRATGRAVCAAFADALRGYGIPDEVLSLPNRLTPAEQARLRDGRPAGSSPLSAAEPLRVQRRVSCRGALVVAKQRIHVGMVHAGRTLTVEAADAAWRVYDDDGLVAEVARTTTKPIARFKVHKTTATEAPYRLSTLKLTRQSILPPALARSLVQREQR